MRRRYLLIISEENISPFIIESIGLEIEPTSKNPMIIGFNTRMKRNQALEDAQLMFPDLNYYVTEMIDG